MKRLILALLLLAAPAAARTWYVDGSCGTAGDGTTVTCGTNGPFKTIAAGIAAATAAGDTVRVKYTGTDYLEATALATAAAGTLGSPIVVTCYVGDTTRPRWVRNTGTSPMLSFNHAYWTLDSLDLYGSDGGTNGILVVDAPNVTVVRTRLHRIARDAVRILVNGDNFTLRDCLIDSVGASGSLHGIVAGKLPNDADGTITGLQIIHNTFRDIAGDGIQFYEKVAGCRNVVVTGLIQGNTFIRGWRGTGITENAIDIKSTALVGDPVKIYDNFFYGWKGNSVQGKAVTTQHCSDYIWTDNNYFDTNIGYGAGGDTTCPTCCAIEYQADGGTVTGGRITRNVMVHSYSGLKLGNTTGSTESLYVYNNTGDSLTGPMFRFEGPVTKGIFRNNLSRSDQVSFGSSGSFTGSIADHNGWFYSDTTGCTPMCSSTDLKGFTADASTIWDAGSAHTLKKGSAAIGRGVDVGLPFSGAVPDLGAKEYSGIAPPGSPIAYGAHPRLFVTGDSLVALRSRIATYYPTEFQAWLNTLSNPGGMSSGQKATYAQWGAMNFAFLNMLRPDSMSARGFTMGDSINTQAKCTWQALKCAKAMIPTIAAGGGQSHEDLSKGYATTKYFPTACVYDWCYSQLSQSARDSIADAFVSAFRVNYNGVNTLTETLHGKDFMANNQTSADIHSILGILAFYGESYPGSAVQDSMYTAFENIWIKRVIVEINRIYQYGSGWHEDLDGYLNDGYTNCGIPIAMFSPAVGTNYIGTMPWFTGFAAFATMNVRPLTLKDGGEEFMERWGTTTNGVGNLPCKAALLTSGFARKAGLGTKGLSKWAHSVMSTSCGTAITEYIGNWGNGVLYWFLYGDAEITAQTPAQAGIAKAQRLGNGEYVFKSDWSDSGTQIVYWPKPLWMYGHVSDDQGHFSIHKFGNLALTAANSKSGDAVLTSAKFPVLMNSVGIHLGGGTAQQKERLDFNGSTTDSLFGAMGFTDVRKAGVITAEDLGHPAYDYIGYNSAASWASSTASISQREFVYSRGAADKEFVVLLDRVRILGGATTNTKIWKMWVPAKPTFVDGDTTRPRADKWTSTNATILGITDQMASTRPQADSIRYTTPATHGRLFLKVLAPTNHRISALGDTAHEWQSGNDDGAMPWGNMNLTRHATRIREYLGWGRIEVAPTDSSSYDAFLTVLQIGDANTLATMTPTARIDAASAKMIGVDVKAAAGNRVILFSASESGAVPSSPVSYTFTPTTTTADHLLLNMQPSTTYYVRHYGSSGIETVEVSTSDPGGSSVVVSNTQGVLAFGLSGFDAPLPGGGPCTPY